MKNPIIFHQIIISFGLYFATIPPFSIKKSIGLFNLRDLSGLLVLYKRVKNGYSQKVGKKVMIDSDLAELYGVKTKALLQTVKRNIERFPSDFMFQLTESEFKNLRSQIVTSSQWGGRRYHPYAFTKQGVAMLSSILNSPGAIQVNLVTS